MTVIGSLQILLFLLVLLALVQPLGWYMARVYTGQSCGLNWLMNSVERFIYRICSIDQTEEMNWKKYLSTMLFFNIAAFMMMYLMQRTQHLLPLNPEGLSSLSPDLAFNTAASFITSTNWQAYSGEVALSYFTQTVGMTALNFISAATGMAMLVALTRGIARHETSDLGNFWVDCVRSILYILLPLSCLYAVILSSQGVIQNFKSYQTVQLTQPYITEYASKDMTGNVVMSKKLLTEQVIPMGPVASREAIKQLGTNGGGFFNTNSAHPFENPTPFTNFLEMLAIFLIPASFCYAYGILVGDKRQGIAILAAILVIMIPMLIITVMAEQAGNPILTALGVDNVAKVNTYPAGNMEGKETRFGIVGSASWAAATTATSNGSVNAMMDSFTPIGGMIPLWLMHLGEVAFGGVGSGVYGMLMLVIITVFMTGLMVGRTPEYMGKKIQSYEMKMASIAVLLMPLMVLVTTAIACVVEAGLSSVSNPDAHGLTQILYAFTSMGNNNGSALAGLNANNIFYNTIGGFVMLISRYWIAISVMAIAGSFALKKNIPYTTGTLVTHTPLFILIQVFITIIIGALSFVPAMALGPAIEQLMLWGQYGY